MNYMLEQFISQSECKFNALHVKLVKNIYLIFTTLLFHIFIFFFKSKMPFQTNSLNSIAVKPCVSLETDAIRPCV